MEEEKKERSTLEFKEIIEKIPDNFNNIILLGLSIFVCFLLAFGLFIKVPGKTEAAVRVASTNPPVILNAQSSGKIIFLTKKTPFQCKSGEYLAMIENSANPQHVQYIKRCIENIDILRSIGIFKEFDKEELTLGELESPYYSFLTTLQKYFFFLQSNDYSYEIQLLSLKIENDSIIIENKRKILRNELLNHSIKQKEFVADSNLYKKQAVLEKDYNQSFLSKANAENQVTSLRIDIYNLLQNIIDTRLKKRNLEVQYRQELGEAQITVFEKLHNLRAAIKEWEKKYVFVSTQAGLVELISIIPNNGFVLAGDPVFDIVFKRKSYQAVAELPSLGAGEVKVGQKVNIKLDLYSYQEYGMLKGQVENITRNSIDQKYIVNISLDNKLISTNGNEFSFAETMHGKAEIITTEKRLIQVFFYKIQSLLSPSPLEEEKKEEKTKNKVRQ